jgi:RNA polymerase sigma factor (TIGR02999 family)
MSSNSTTLELLQAHRAGDPNAVDRLFAHLYDELREVAHLRLRQLRPGETLNTTGLLHESYVRLVDQNSAQVQDRSHFLALASRAMRFILVDYARSRSAMKRGGKQRNVTLDRIQIAADDRAEDLLQLNEALERLKGYSERLAEVVDYRFFGGLTHQEIAELTDRSVPTVKRDWARARAWLLRVLEEGRGEEAVP